MEAATISDKERQRLIEIRKKYYTIPSVKYLIVSNLNINRNLKIKRELAFLTKHDYNPHISIRYLPGYKMDFLDEHFKTFRILEAPFTNLYSSLAHLNYLPPTTYNLRKRSEEKCYREFNEKYTKFMVGYDVLFDIDNLDIRKAHSDAKILKEILEKNKISFSLRFSGRKGLHFLIPFENINYGIKDLPAFVRKIEEFIYNVSVIYDIESIDYSITDNKRVCKIPYTLDKDKICLPLTDKQFEHFDVNKMTYDYIIKNIQLANRGILLRDYGLSKKELSENFKEFLTKHT